MAKAKQAVLVTGAGRGLGWGVAQAFARAGAAIAVTDVNEADIERSVQDIKERGGDALGMTLDTADPTQFKSAVDAMLERWGRVDVLIHAAIYMPLRSFEATSPEDWWRQIDVGLGGLYHGTRAVWDAMKSQGGGHIMGVASGSSVRGYKDEVAYCTLKHAQEGFIKALALEAAPLQRRAQHGGAGQARQAHPFNLGRARKCARRREAKLGRPRFSGRGVRVARRTAPRAVYRLALRRRADCGYAQSGGTRPSTFPPKKLRFTLTTL